MHELHTCTLGAMWDPGRELVWNCYRGLEPGDEHFGTVERRDLRMAKDVSVAGAVSHSALVAAHSRAGLRTVAGCVLAWLPPRVGRQAGRQACQKASGRACAAPPQLAAYRLLTLISNWLCGLPPPLPPPSLPHPNPCAGAGAAKRMRTLTAPAPTPPMRVAGLLVELVGIQHLPAAAPRWARPSGALSQFAGGGGGAGRGRGRQPRGSAAPGLARVHDPGSGPRAAAAGRGPVTAGPARKGGMPVAHPPMSAVPLRLPYAPKLQRA